MPVYNVEAYLSEAIESVLHQSFSDFELILINDGSTDKSLSIAQKYGNSDNRIRIITQKNAGLSSARNTGIKIAKGKYVFFIDSDDYLNANTLEDVKFIFDNNDIDIVFFKANTFIDNYGDKNMLDRFNLYYEREYLKEDMYHATEYYGIMSSNNNFVASACLQAAKLDLIKNAQITFLKGIINEDELYTRQLLFTAKNVYFSNKKFYNRRVRELSISTSEIKPIKPFSMLKIAEKIYELNRVVGNSNLKKDYEFFFSEALRIAEQNFKNNKKLAVFFLKSNLFIELKKYRKRVFFLMFPGVRYLIHFFRACKAFCVSGRS